MARAGAVKRKVVKNGCAFSTVPFPFLPARGKDAEAPGDDRATKVKGTGSPNHSGKPPTKQKQPYGTSREDESTAFEVLTTTASPTRTVGKRRGDGRSGQRERDKGTAV